MSAWNPYFEKFATMHPVGEMPWPERSFGALADLTVKQYRRRTEWVRLFAWAIPTPEAINLLASYSPLVEIGAGTGYWARLIAEAGGDILAYDIHPPRRGKKTRGHNRYHGRIRYFDVRKGGPSKLRRYPNRTLFLCWPPYDAPMAWQCLRKYRGRHVAIVSEGEGGCSADDKFWTLLRSSGFRPTVRCDLPQWVGIHDYLAVWER